LSDPRRTIALVLEEMRISGLGVIADAVVEPHPGLTVVTGETGAGKTMVVEGLSLLFGGRADAGLVRTGAPRAVVEGRLSLPPSAPAVARAVEAGGELDDGALLVSRTVSAEGRSRAHAGGRGVPVAVLAELAETLVALHGQHDQQRLVRPAEQRALLDRYAGLGDLLAEWSEAYERLRTVTASLAEITARRRERAQEADLLRLGLAEVAGVAPVVGEDQALATEVARLAHADTLRAAATAAHAVLAGDPAEPDAVDATGLVGAARHALAPAAGHDPALDALAARLAELSYLLADVAADLGSYAAAVDADPERLAEAQARQAALGGLTRKYADDLPGVLAWAEAAAARLAGLDADDDTVSSLTAERDALVARLGALAAALTAAREAAGERLAAAVSTELAALAMPDARLTVAVTQEEAREAAGESVAGLPLAGLPVAGRRVAYGPTGTDTVELLLTPHPGAPPRPVARGASGGELARVMLALEVVLAGTDPVPTMVFDEVDAGVGGRAAVEVGRRLARLARDHQVIVVTHLPQVAAFADRHVHVAKAADGGVTASGITTLDGAARVAELSRMLAGLDDSDLARGHAEELLAMAAAAKVEPAPTAPAPAATKPERTPTAPTPDVSARTGATPAAPAPPRRLAAAKPPRRARTGTPPAEGVVPA
jgi:DNA repair protein RecN (Recombination protein N)